MKRTHKTSDHIRVLRGGSSVSTYTITAIASASLGRNRQINVRFQTGGPERTTDWCLEFNEAQLGEMLTRLWDAQARHKAAAAQ